MSSLVTSPGSSSSPVESRNDVLLESLSKFYKVPAHLRVLTDILRGKTKISLRSIDWLVTNFAKKNNTHLVVGDRTINLYLEYKSGLRAFSKRAFDPFQRRDRVYVTDADGQSMATTVGQLNFFRFAIQNGVVAFALNNAGAIEADMLDAIRHRTPGSSTSPTEPEEAEPPAAVIKTKRKELSRAAIKSATATNVKVTVRFA